jgi:hypothetical protein
LTKNVVISQSKPEFTLTLLLPAVYDSYTTPRLYDLKLRHLNRDADKILPLFKPVIKLIAGPAFCGTVDALPMGKENEPHPRQERG